MPNIHVHVRAKPDRPNLQLYYVDPLTGQDRTRSTLTDDWDEAQRKAADWERQLQQSIVDSDACWDSFRERFEDEHLAALSAKSRKAYRTALNAFESVIGSPRFVAAVDTSVLSRFQAGLRTRGLPSSSVATYLRHVLSALSWGAKIGFLDRVPKCIMPRVGKRKLMRGRPLTEQEFAQLLAAARTVRPDDWTEWQRYLRGLWHSGLRLQESLLLSWSQPPLRVDLGGRRPRLVFHAEAQKNRSDEIIPITPDFHALLLETPEEQRTGRVFHVPRRDRVVADVVKQIATAAQVVVNERGKIASAHDLRRSFGTRYALKCHPIVLQRLMRHRAIETTLKYYVDIDADALADQLWEIGAACTPECTPKTPETTHSRPKHMAKCPRKQGSRKSEKTPR